MEYPDISKWNINKLENNNILSQVHNTSFSSFLLSNNQKNLSSQYSEISEIKTGIIYNIIGENDFEKYDNNDNGDYFYNYN